jgi:hypothetical protein
MKLFQTIFGLVCLCGFSACMGVPPAPGSGLPGAAGVVEPLFTVEQAQQIIAQFKEAYTKLNSPPIDVRVNPPLGIAIANPPAANPRGDDLATQQTKREVERLIGRPLRLAGVQLMDADLSKAAEVTFEVLISERKLADGNTVPDIQVTAVRIADGNIVGQATVLDLFPNRAEAGRRMRQYSVQQLTEATALAVMRDIATTAK